MEKVRGEGWRWGVFTLFNILRTAGESGVYRIFPISRGLTEFHTIFVTGLDSRLCIKELQKGAEGWEKNQKCSIKQDAEGIGVNLFE